MGAKTEEHTENRHALLWAALQLVAEHAADAGPKELVEFRTVRALALTRGVSMCECLGERTTCVGVCVSVSVCAVPWALGVTPTCLSLCLTDPARQTLAMQLIAFIAEGSWPADTRLVAVHCLADFAALADGALVTKDLASSVVLQLCVHAVSGLKKDKSQVP